jgi:segregation and condensation protein A
MSTNQAPKTENQGIPHDLYIPPEALEVALQNFTGPLDLLLYLIKKQNIDILDLSILTITQQYIAYMQLMKAVQFELSADYLVMAATLAEIKSRMLLPKRGCELDDSEEDPRAWLIRQLQDYQQMQLAGEKLQQLPYAQRDFQVIRAVCSAKRPESTSEPVELLDLFLAYASIMKRESVATPYTFTQENLSVNTKIHSLLAKMAGQGTRGFHQLLDSREGREGVAVNMLALLELVRQRALDVVQENHNGDIFVMTSPGKEKAYA